MKVINFGSCNIDYVYLLDHIVVPGETENVDGINVFPGGKGLNQSIALARAGVDVYHAGCIGEDGEMLLETLSKSGVKTSLVRRVEGKNGQAIIQVNKHGENCILVYAGSNGKIDKEYVDSTLEKFSKGDLLLLQNEISNVHYIIQKAHEKGMCIVFNPSPFNDKIKDIDYNMLSYIIVNEVEAKCISGKENYKETIEFFKKEYPNLKVMLTLGKDGCVYFDKDTQVHHPIFDVEVVDTTAAGDTFTGYFIAGIAQNESMQRTLKLASCASALAVSRQGASPSIPQRDEVCNMADKLKTL